jgi:hypothetical protein
MNTTLFFAQIWGPVLLAIGIGFFISTNHYKSVYRDIEKEPLASLIFGMAAIIAGIIQILSHNTWATVPEWIISLLGWALLIKGLAFAIVPKFIELRGDWSVKMKIVPGAGVLLILLGVYLSYLGYFV